MGRSGFEKCQSFYNPDRKKGLYGNNNALSLAVTYYNKALEYWYDLQPNLAMFYLGAAVHLVQDMTVPHHANVRLLDNHRQYENFIKGRILTLPDSQLTGVAIIFPV